MNTFRAQWTISFETSPKCTTVSEITFFIQDFIKVRRDVLGRQQISERHVCQKTENSESRNYQEQSINLLLRPTDSGDRDLIYASSSTPHNAISSGTNLGSYRTRYEASFSVGTAAAVCSLSLVALSVTILNTFTVPCSEGRQ
jgi:hypothetical protein